MYFLIVLEVGGEIRVLAGVGIWWEFFLPDLQKGAFSPSSCMATWPFLCLCLLGERSLLLVRPPVLLIKGPILLTSFNLNYHLSTLCLNTVTLGIWALTSEFWWGGGDTIQSIAWVMKSSLWFAMHIYKHLNRNKRQQVALYTRQLGTVLQVVHCTL